MLAKGKDGISGPRRKRRDAGREVFAASQSLKAKYEQPCKASGHLRHAASASGGSQGGWHQRKLLADKIRAGDSLK